MAMAMKSWQILRSKRISEFTSRETRVGSHRRGCPRYQAGILIGKRDYLKWGSCVETSRATHFVHCFLHDQKTWKVFASDRRCHLRTAVCDGADKFKHQQSIHHPCLPRFKCFLSGSALETRSGLLHVLIPRKI